MLQNRAIPIKKYTQWDKSQDDLNEIYSEIGCMSGMNSYLNFYTFDSSFIFKNLNEVLNFFTKLL